MEYIHTRQCLEKIVESVGTVYVEQLERFFRNSEEAAKLPYFIKEYISLRLFDYNKEKNLVRWHVSPELSDEVVRRRLMAFWIIANFGVEGIRQVIPLRYPSQYYFITTTNEAYDLTVCTQESEAKTAFHTLKLFQIPGEDDVNHIAIVPNREVGKAVMEALPEGFDSYAVFDPQTKLPSYFTE